MPDILTLTSTPVVLTNQATPLYFIAPGAGIIVATGAALATAGSALISAQGILKAACGILFVDGSVPTNARDTVQVGSLGIIAGTAYAGVVFIDDGSVLTNQGQISGARGVIWDSANTAQASNSGTIIGYSTPTLVQASPVPLATGMGFYQSNDIYLTNSGRIEGNCGLWLGESDGNIDNSGVIQSTSLFSPAVWITGGLVANLRVRLVNTGEIRATGNAIEVSNVAMDIVNSGLIAGNIATHALNDRIDSSLGTVLGLIDAGNGNDRVWSGLANDDVHGGGGNDTLVGGAGDDFLNGDPLNDKLFGGAGDDDLTGGTGPGNDSLYGGGGDDSLAGGDGSDLLNGGAGQNLLTGGLGADIFLFRDGGQDRLTDFTNGTDSLDLQALGFSAFAQVAALARDSAAGLFIDLTSKGGGSILLDGFLKAGFDATDVLI